jgi:hypothetical protein
LRTSRFFPEPDDVPEKRAAYDEDNLKVNELLYQRVDVEDDRIEGLSPLIRFLCRARMCTSPLMKEMRR